MTLEEYIKSLIEVKYDGSKIHFDVIIEPYRMYQSYNIKEMQKLSCNLKLIGDDRDDIEYVMWNIVDTVLHHNKELCLSSYRQHKIKQLLKDE